jgi:hypothetical protein
MRRTLSSYRLLVPLALPLVTASSMFLPACREKQCATNDLNCDEVPDDIGTPVYDANGVWVDGDFNGDHIGDGKAIDENGDGKIDGVGIDRNNDGFIDSIDRDGDGRADKTTGVGELGTGGSPGAGGAGSGGAPPNVGGLAAGGSASGGSAGPTTTCLSATAVQSAGDTISGSDDGARYYKANTYRQACADFQQCPPVQYRFIANGWGPNWQSHTLTFAGSTFSVDAFQGTRGDGYEPAGYPTMFCGLYSNEQSGACGLPALVSSLSELNTGLRWSHNGGQGTDYNVAYDIWMANGSTFAGFLMVWYRDPPMNQPAGRVVANNVVVGSDPAPWDVWTGTVNGSPIVNYVRKSGEESYDFSFDVLDFVNHAKTNYALPGDTIQSVAIGFEIWSGPVAGLKVEDFCVDVHTK